MQTTANIIEIFSSIQGEGPRVGESHLFVRFEGCSLSCKFCDTPTSFIKNPTCRVEDEPFTKEFSHHPNPLTVDQLNGLLDPFDEEKILSVTGGEPLESADFLEEWLPTLSDRKVLLETAGVHPKALNRVLSHVDIVSMDLKLPSVTGMRAYWEEHRDFLIKARAKEVYCKVVVSAQTDRAELCEAIELVHSVRSTIPFVLQPASAFAGFREAPSPEQVSSWYALAARRLPQVAVIPQLHKQLKVL